MEGLRGLKLLVQAIHLPPDSQKPLRYLGLLELDLLFPLLQMFLSDGLEGLHRFSCFNIYVHVLSLLSYLMSAGNAEPRLHHHDIFLVPLIKIYISADRFVHLGLAPCSLSHDHILVSLLLLLE